MARQFQATPIRTEDASFGRINVGKESVKHSAGFQPLADFNQYLAGMMHVLKHIKARNSVKGIRLKGRVLHITHEDFSAGSCAGLLRSVGRNLDSIEPPWPTFERFKK